MPDLVEGKTEAAPALSEPQFSPLEMGLRTDPLLHLKRWWDHIGQMPAGAWPPWEHSAGYLLLSSVHLGAGALGEVEA